MNKNEENGLLSNLPESGILFTIIGIGCYIIGFFYVSSYFGRIGISTSLLDLPFTNYLTMSVLAILPSFLICYIFITFNEMPFDNRICCFFANIPLLILGIVTILFNQMLFQRSNSTLDLLLYYFLFAFGSFAIIFFVYTVYSNKFIFKFQSRNLFSKIVTLGFLLMVLGTLSMYIGYSLGTNVIEGDPHSATSIQLYLFNDTANLSGKEMILVTHQNEKYFIIEKEKPAPPYPKVYVIDDSQVRLAILETNLSSQAYS